MTDTPPETVAVAAASTAAPSAARAEEDVLRDRLRFLNRATARIGAALDGAAAVRALCAVAAEELADLAEVYLTDDIHWAFAPSLDGRRVAPPPPDPNQPGAGPAAADRGVHPAPSGPPLRRTAHAVGPRIGPPRRGGGEIAVDDDVHLVATDRLAWMLASGHPVLVPRTDDRHAEDWVTADGGPRWAPGHSLIAVPLLVRGRALGIAALVRAPGRPPFSETDLLTAVQLAEQTGLAVDNARLYQLQAHTADTLQRSMLPGRPPPLFGAEIAHRYRPASAEARVGGDWFDAIPLPGGRVALVVGDVMGHGIESAAVMGRLRTAVRTLAALDTPPEELLRHLDSLAGHLGEHHIATCVYCVYDPVRHTCTIANAGHVPPLLIGPGGDTTVLPVPAGVPVGAGVGDGAFQAAEFPTPPGHLLALCTDGLVESRDRDIDDGLAALATALTGPPRSLEQLCDGVVRALLGSAREDDAALLLARFRGIDAADVRSWALGATAAAPGRARRLVRRALAEWGLGEQDDVVLLLVTELVTNAVRVASRPIQVRLLRTDVLVCEVTDDDHRMPVRRDAGEDDEQGRGVALVSRLARRWGASRTPAGKTVWFEIATGPPAADASAAGI